MGMCCFRRYHDLGHLMTGRIETGESVSDKVFRQGSELVLHMVAAG